MKNATGILIALILTACGGGGGGGTENPPPVVNPNPEPGNGGNGTLTFDPPRLEATVMQAESLTLQVVGTASSSIQEQLNLRLEVTADFSPEVALEQLGARQYRARLKISESAASGTRSGFINVSLCRDAPAVCASPYPGSPWKLPYQLNIISTADNLKPLSKLDGASTWSNFQGNAGHTGYVATSKWLDPANFSLRWMRSKSTGADGSSSEMLTTGSHVVFNSSSGADQAIVALNEADGNAAWTRPLPFFGNPVLVAGHVVAQVRSFQSSLKTLDAATGAIVAEEKPVTTGRESSLWLTGDADSVYVGEQQRRVDAATATVRWMEPELPIFYQGERVDAVDAQHVYSMQKNVSAQAEASLVIKRREDGGRAIVLDDPQNIPYAFTEKAPSTTVLDGADRVLAARYGYSEITISSFSISQKKRLWTMKKNFLSVPIVANGVVYLVFDPFRSGEPRQLHAYAGDSGALLWSMPLTGDNNPININGLTYQVVAVNNLIFISNLSAEKGNYTHAVDPATRKIVWQLPASGRLAVSDNGLLYIARPNKSLLAINLQ